MRDAFLGMIAHEVRAPLSAIGSAATVLRDRPHAMTIQQTHNMTSGIAASAQHLSRLISDLIDAGRTGEGRFPCQVSSIEDLGEVVRAAAASFGEEHPISVSVARNVALLGDADRLTQVVSNLISNAVKYAGGAAVEVTLCERGDDAVISVVDHGRGIPPEKADRVFDRYTRLHRSGSTPGTGLGLFIARELARAHGGDITFHTTPGGGATFEVTLPMRVRAPR
jgi:signal transduction histidine kinase